MGMSTGNFEIFPWDKNFETGISKIDEQHKILVDILNRLAAHLANLSSEIALNKIVDELIDYTDYHFKTEETIWNKYFIEDEWFLNHEKTHGSFVEYILNMKKNKKEKEFDEVIYELVLYLAKWLAYHILDTDKRMAKVVLAIDDGMSLEDAKNHSLVDMSGSMKTLIETVLKMYSSISTRTLDLMREKALRIKVEKALKISEERWKFILDSSNENIWDWDIENDIIHQSQDGIFTNDILQYELKDFESKSHIHPDDIQKVKTDFQAHINGETEFYSNKHRIIKSDGSWSWILSRGKVISRDANGRAQRIVGTHSNITEREIASIIYNNSSQAMFVSDFNNKIININPAFTQITQYTKEEVIGKDPKMLSSKLFRNNFYKEMWENINSKNQWSGEVINKRKNGEEYVQELKINVVKSDEGITDHYVALFSDISEKKKADEIIQRQANFDTLTHLENRRMFDIRLSQEIQNSIRTKLPFAVLFVDLDHFKDVNDNLGHSAGDNILIQASNRIKEVIRDTDILARFGGDEFTLILPQLNDFIPVERVAQSIIDILSKPFVLDKNMIYLSASIGISLYPDDGQDESTLLKHADQAMYQAKKTGRSRFNFFTGYMQELAQKRQKMLADLHVALKLNQFELYYQPIVEVKSENIHKGEALIRWNHPKQGLISPNDFIPLAEQTGLIVDIGNWVFKEATLQTKKWKEQYNIDFKMSINKSPAQFKSSSSLDDWMEYLEEIKLEGANISIEITENLLIENNTTIANKLLRFRDEGIEIAIDDFGTGYSSLSYLKKFDIDYLKIDKSFIDNIETSHQDKILCEAIIAMAHKLKIIVIGEGIETEEQRDLLSSMDCDYLQGYLYSKPIPSSEFERLFLQK